MADKMATMFGDVTDHRQPHHPWNIPLNHDTREAGDIATFKKLIKGRRGGGGGGGEERLAYFLFIFSSFSMTLTC